jgi:hypothetical protein
MQGLQPLALVAAGMVAIVFAASCGDGDEADGAEGFERFEEDGLAVEYPSSWTVDEDVEGGNGGVLISVHRRRDGKGLFVRLTVSREENDFRSAAQAGRVLAAERPFQLNDGRLVDDRRAKVPGSDGAWRVEASYKIELDRGGTVPGRSVELIALKEDEQVPLTLAGPTKTMDQLPVERIVGSLDLT